MIALLTGEVASRSTDRLVLDVQGVGYLVQIPASLGLDDASRPKSRLRLYISTKVREDAITLYGFKTDQEREVFEILCEVNGIGPRSALALLSTLTVDALARAIETDDLRALTRAPGVGRKTASRLCLELKQKLTAHFQPTAPTPSQTRAAPEDPLPLALARLDYRKTEIDRALSEVPGPDDAPLPQRLKAAIRLLSSSP